MSDICSGLTLKYKLILRRLFVFNSLTFVGIC